MTQHITQDAIRAAGGIIHRDGNIFFTNIEKLNAAIQHYLDQRKAELLVLPAPDKAESGWTEPVVYYFLTEKVEAYGKQCAAHAREKALEEAKQLIIKLDLVITNLNGYEAVIAIEALKGK